MQTLHFTQFINAPREKVWETMLSSATYPLWTDAFNPGSTFKGDWSEGSKMLFIGPDPENPDSETEMGMVSRIKENREHEFISIEHYGLYKDGVEDTESDEAKKWAPSFENYTLTSKDGGTEVTIDVDIMDEYAVMFEEMWHKALAELKKLCEE